MKWPVASGHYMGGDRGDALVQVSDQGGVEGYRQRLTAISAETAFFTFLISRREI